MNYLDFYNPIYKIRIGGVDLPKEIEESILSFNYLEQDSKVSKLTVVFANKDFKLNSYKGFSETKEVEFVWGYPNNLSNKHYGIIRLAE